MNYKLIEEHHYKGDWYYTSDDYHMYMAKRSLVLPNHPMVSYKIHNHESYFDRVEDSDLILRILKDDSL